MAPHKKKFDGNEMTSTMAGANDRADFFLLAVPLQGSPPIIIATIYHTTNVPPLTSSNEKTMLYPESRLLSRSMDCVTAEIRLAVWRCAKKLRCQRGFDWRAETKSPSCSTPTHSEEVDYDTDSNPSVS